MKEGFLAQLNDYQLLKMGSAPPHSLIVNFLSTKSKPNY